VRREPVIAIDGPGSSGKGTIARAVARTLGFQYVDTGAMYRSVALVAHERGIAPDDEDRVAAITHEIAVRFVWDGDILRVFLVDPDHPEELGAARDVTRDIRQEHVSQGASKVSALPRVRAGLLDAQRRLAAGGGVVMDGRDIGTVVLPDADLKVFLDADVDERARRRHEELIRRGEIATYESVRRDLNERDHRDRNRAAAPLKRAEDAVYVDSSELTIRQAVDVVLALVKGLRRPVDTGSDTD
jgi:cytidylate kinase